YDDFISMLDDFGLVQMVTEPTRSENVLDLFLTSNHTLVHKIEIAPGIADHDVMVADINLKPNVERQNPRSVPLYRKTDWQGFRKYISVFASDFMLNYRNKNVEDLWNSFKTAISRGILKFVPIKRFGAKKSLPWITQEIRRLRRKRDKLFKKQRSSRREKDIQHFKQVKHLIQTKIRLAYDKYLQDLLGLTAENSDKSPSGFTPKKLFSLIKNARQDSQGISTLFDKNQKEMVTENKSKATILNLQFQSVFSQLSPLRLGQLCIEKVQDFLDNIPENFKSKYPVMPEIIIDANGILKLLSNLKTDKAAGPDDIKPVVLKELRNEITPVIKAIFEQSLETGQLPKDWTTARVSPLFKKGDKSDPANYRPISLTCVLCKVMEHIVASNLTRHLSRNNILYGLQHGFREKRSCETQLIELVEELGKQLTQGHQIDLVLLDFSKAFDKVNHLKLLFKLSFHGVKGKTLKWISSFLEGRTQAVVLEGECSPDVRVTSGVPQGSVLGPLLFLLYINDLPENIHSQVRLFADDTAVYLTVENQKDSNILQDDLDTLQKWERTWDMEFNPNKCQVLHISRSRQPIHSQYTLHGEILESVDCARYLGVSISKDLSWNTHINEITSKANRTLGFVKRNIRTKNQAVKELAYKSLVRPQVEYASSVWSPYTKQNIHKIEMVQRRAARWVSGKYSSYDSVSAMLGNLGWRPLEHRRNDSRLAMFYKIQYGLVAIEMPTYFERPTRITRHMHPLCFRQVHCAADYYRYSFFPMTVVLWNRLPAEVVVLPDLDSFKTEVSKISYPMP
ncbi:MAG: reverse transcriptase family protein, partial [Candidatus Thiodiazotropha sp.]